MSELRLLLRCIWLFGLMQNCVSTNSSTEHPRHHRHERSRLRRQHGTADPSVFYLVPEDPDLPPDQTQAESGDWGSWSAPSECSRTCGGGVQFQTRECSPYSNCRGSKTRYISCNIQDCPEGTDFRAEQCAAYNLIQYEGGLYEWIPYTHAENQCALNCMPKRERYYYRHKDAVEDGTPCNEDSFDVCVQGKCLPVGCDKLLGSTAKEDSCRVCGGNGSTCSKKSGVAETNALIPGYMDLFLIPPNATNIRIQERRPSNNYLAVRNQDNHFYLNGDWTINNSGVLKFAGTKFTYDRKTFPYTGPEVLYGLGPTTEPLYIALLYQEPNPGIEYVYSVPVGSVRESTKQGYLWRASPFSECNVTCGGGIQERKVWCAYGSEQVGDGLCDPASEPATSKLCGEVPCPAEWVADKWSPCSAPCGELGYQTRQVNCLQAVGFTKVSVTEHLCKDEKPETSRSCQEKGPCPIWFVGPWKPCDRLCGEGKQTRDVICYKKVDGLVEILPDSQCLETKPEAEQPCTLRPCAGLDWITSEWSGCSDKCGAAIETRLVKCADEKGREYGESMCHSYRKPESVKSCPTVPCSSLWFASQWSDCSAKCGQGVQTRSVLCASLDGNKLVKMDDSSCVENLKPESKKDCKAEQECKGAWFVSPFGPCSKPCGGGIQERVVICLRDNRTVNEDECDVEHFISGNSKDCNSQPCGEDELIPVSTAQVITEEESEECDYDEYDDYTDTTLDGIIRTDGVTMMEVSSVTDEIEGSGGYSDDLIFISSTPDSLGSSVEASSSAVSSSDMVSPSSSSSESVASSTEGIVASSSASAQDSSGTLADEASTQQAAGGSSAESSVSDGSSPSGDMSSLPAVGSTSDMLESSKMSSESSFSSSETLGGTSELPEVSPSGSSEKPSSESSSDSTTDDAGKSIGTSESTSVAAESSSVATESSSVAAESSSMAAESSSVAAESSSETAGTAASSSEDTTSMSTSDAGETSTFSSSSDSSVSESSSISSSNTDQSEPTEKAGTVEDSSTSTMDRVSSDVTADTSDGYTTSGSSDGTSGLQASSSEQAASSIDIVSSTDASPSSESSLSSGSDGFISSTAASSEVTGVSESSVASITDMLSTKDSGSSSYETSTHLQSSEASSTPESETSSSGTSSGMSTESSTGAESDTSTHGASTEMSTEISSVSAGESVSTETAASGEASSESSSSPESTDITEAVFGFTTESAVDKAVTKEKTLRKCKRRKGKKKCVSSPFGCCPDGKTEAKGPFSKGCPMPKTCKEAEHGCCPDGLSPAKGPNGKGCPKSLCHETLFGCCPDEITPSTGNNFEGCPIQTTPMPDCNVTLYGCCPDGKPADGPFFEGCVETCSKTEFGCCPDGFTVKTGLDYEGCDIPSNETCANSTYGCCPDGINTAEGPDEEGCFNCTEWRFGCCPDGVTAAKGVRQFGCAPACTTSDFGCCSDLKTYAHGPNQEGCCLNTPFGCCQDNIAPASGPNYQGCDCRNSIYGCCPDSKTSATGPNNEGCGCKYSEYGCCPDRQTTAIGPNFEGCPCHTYQFGCCPDGVTVVKGPYLEGCGCDKSAFGCCPDSKTAKTGPDQNCTCEASQYGCCPDGVNAAAGENFEGCENVPVKGEACFLPRDNGHCREFKIHYWFDNTYGGCAKFWYGGCGGNKNRFSSVEECKNICVHPTGKDVCDLPMSRGSCRHDTPMWYYDKTYKQCRPFSWTGCLGNSNRFHSRKECELQCGSQDHIDPCEQTLEHGPCNGTFERWYYNKDEKDCIPFVYGGCKGTQNNFLSQAACRGKCMAPGQQKQECLLPKATGTCSEKVPKWYFEPKEKRCMPFYYSGCGGNGNHFDSFEECNGYCPVYKEKDVCALPSSVGDCSTYTLRWYFDTLENQCKQFYWGSCGGNANNFLTEQDCLNRCDQKIKPEVPFNEDMCSLGYERGRCSESISKWFYDSADGTCKNFEYSGCDGNGNRFDSEEECLQSCGRTQDPCSLPKVSGPCDNYERLYYFDSKLGRCRQFFYGGCSGNGNRFANAQECESRCMREGRREPEPEREREPEPEREREPEPEREREPEPEREGEPEREPEPEPERERQPEPERERQPEPEQEPERKPLPPPAQPDESNLCYLRYDPGPCYETIEAWYYDPQSEKCTRFVYGGCGGNANRFLSEEQCERQCGVFKSQEVCSDDVEEGTCSNPVEKFYFDHVENVCRAFTYYGCGGNPNRFSSLDECNSLCRDFIEPKIPQGTDQDVTNRGICSLPSETGSCEASRTRFYFDTRQGTCTSFTYSGCGGNLNNFETLEDCTNTCSAFASAPQPDGLDPNAIDVGQRPVKSYCPDIDTECNNLLCSYGIEKWVDSEGCEKCKCHDPCSQSNCPGRCVVRLVSERPGSIYKGFCEGEEPPQPKTGECPEISDSEVDTDCSPNCNIDSECPKNSKCCYNGCTTVCTVVSEEEQPVARPEEYAPTIADDTDQRVEGEEGNVAGLHCIARGNPTPTVSWTRNGEMLSSISGSKYRILQNGTLEIILLRRDDSGTYTCEASNGVEPSANRDYELIVRAGRPLAVAVLNNQEDTDVVVTLGSPAVMRCYSIGFPFPAINWFRGSTVLPVSSTEFEQRRDNSLFIRAVSLTNLGFYTCQVYNGQGRPASRDLVLKAFGPVSGEDPNDVTHNEFLVPSLQVPSSNYQPPPPPAYHPQPEPQPVEPLKFGVNSSSIHLKAGAAVNLTCSLLNGNASDGVSVVFSWLKNEIPVIPDAERIFTQGNQLTILRTEVEDSGNYTCVFEYDGKGGVTQTVPLLIQKVLLHPECIDHEALANCSLIVNAKFCVHKYYAKFCCKSCTEAGQLSSYWPEGIPPWEKIQPRSWSHRRSPRAVGRMLPSRLTPINAPDLETVGHKIRLKKPLNRNFRRRKSLGTMGY